MNFMSGKNKVNSQITGHREELNRHDISIEKVSHLATKTENNLTRDYLKSFEFHSAMEEINDRLNHSQHAWEDINRSLLSTDNYIEKYLPIKIHKFIIGSLRNVFDQK